MDKLRLETKSTIDVSVQELARLFWSMDNEEQARFFDVLATLELEDTHAKDKKHFSFQGWQWDAVGRTLREPEHEAGRYVLMSMAANLYLHTLMGTPGYESLPWWYGKE